MFVWRYELIVMADSLVQRFGDKSFTEALIVPAA